VQIGGEVNRTLMVLKARGSRHSNQYREFIITDSGIQFMEVYTGKGGMLTGVARLEQEYREELEAQHRKQEIESKKKEIQHLKSALQSDIASTESNIEKASIELDILEAEDQISQRARLLRESLRESTSGTNRLHQHIQSNQMFKRDQNQ
jgi:circadian clock protein KaiC